MVQLILTEEEQELLVNLLENDLSDLRMEISDTDRWEYREMLKSRENLLRSIQKKLEQALPERSPL